MKINAQYNRIAKALHKEARRGRPFAIPLLTEQAVVNTQDILSIAKNEFPKEMETKWFCRKPFNLASDVSSGAYVCFRDEKIADYVAGKLRWRSYDPPVFTINKDKKPKDALKSYKVFGNFHRPDMD